MRATYVLVITAMTLLTAPLSFAQQSADELLAPTYAKKDAQSKTDAKAWSAAESAWLKATQLNPTDPNAWLELGRSRYYGKKYLEAIEPMEKADALGVSYAWDMPYFEACCYALAGKDQEAMGKLESAINLGFRDLRSIATDDDLKSLRGTKKFENLTDADDISKLGRTQGIVHDIRFFERELKRLDYRQRNYGGTGLDQFADKFAKDAPHLSDNQVMVRFMEMAGLMRDGHTGIFPMRGSSDGLPVFFTLFQDGVFITATTDAHKDLLGSRLVAIDGNSVEKALAAVAPLFGQENSQWLASRGPSFLRKPRCLNGLGLSPTDKEGLLSLEKDGVQQKVTLTADAADPDKTWITYSSLLKGDRPLAFQHRDKHFWYQYLPDSKTVYFQYNAVQDEEKQTVADFAKEMFAFVDSHDVDRMVVDTRFNGGGNNFLNMPLVLGLAASKINQKGKLFVITSKSTFSAAMCFVTQVDRYTHAIFAGEPTGSSPNFIGESIPVNLRYVKMSGSISDLYWQNSVAMDHRIWISPDIYVPPTFASFSKNQDPVMDAILAYKQ
jgi:hypothetical protein